MVEMPKKRVQGTLFDPDPPPAGRIALKVLRGNFQNSAPT